MDIFCREVDDVIHREADEDNDGNGFDDAKLLTVELEWSCDAHYHQGNTDYRSNALDDVSCSQQKDEESKGNGYGNALECIYYQHAFWRHENPSSGCLNQIFHANWRNFILLIDKLLKYVKNWQLLGSGVSWVIICSYDYLWKFDIWHLILVGWRQIFQRFWIVISSSFCCPRFVSFRLDKFRILDQTRIFNTQPRKQLLLTLSSVQKLDKLGIKRHFTSFHRKIFLADILLKIKCPTRDGGISDDFICNRIHFYL